MAGNFMGEDHPDTVRKIYNEGGLYGEVCEPNAFIDGETDIEGSAKGGIFPDMMTRDGRVGHPFKGLRTLV